MKCWGCLSHSQLHSKSSVYDGLFIIYSLVRSFTHSFIHSFLSACSRLTPGETRETDTVLVSGGTQSPGGAKTVRITAGTKRVMEGSPAGLGRLSGRGDSSAEARSWFVGSQMESLLCTKPSPISVTLEARVILHPPNLAPAPRPFLRHPHPPPEPLHTAL